MKIYNLEQGSQEWLDMRKGRATASEFDRIVTPTGKPSASAAAYMEELATECAVNNNVDFKGNKATEWGHAHEEEAGELFAKTTGHAISNVGFCISAFSQLVACSPDNLIENDYGVHYSGLEIKCPYNVNNHVRTLRAGVLPAKHKNQVHGSMVVCGFDTWHFMSYFPGLKPLILEIKRDEDTEKIEKALHDFAKKYGAERPKILAEIMPEGGFK